MNKKIVLVGAGSTSFGPAMFNDIFLSDILKGSTIVLHDINKEKLELIYEILQTENERFNKKFNLERTTNRTKALNAADFIINSIEVGDRMELWRQDYEIPRKHGSTQILGECGGPGGTFHTWRIIPPIVEIVKEAEEVCPDAFFINFSNPLSRVCLAIKRSVKKLKFIGLCHQIAFMVRHLPKLFNKSIKELKLNVAGLNHFAFLLGLMDLSTGKDLMPSFNVNAMSYFLEHEDRFEFSTLTFEVFKRFGHFSYVGDNHLGEYLQFGEEFTKTQDMIDWIDFIDNEGQMIYEKYLNYHKRLKRGRYPRKGILSKEPSGERAIPIIEAIIKNKNSYEFAVNIPNDNLIENLPQDLILECSALINKSGAHGVKIGILPKNITALLHIEALIQDLCVDAALKKSKEMAIICLAIDPNVGSFEMAENIFNEMFELQKSYLPNFK
ncbi:MAG: hypothetical protein JSV23_01370 [Promethearchaeota archaeon]|nr:MAG: hypothetical protein JSV23_01370 [Candidatus Lokiarchaeota archaeon]